MAVRPVFCVRERAVRCVSVEFEWFAGFAVSQRQKSIDSLHCALLRVHPTMKPLEVSSKSASALGRKLSAFSLTLDGRTLENVFQSAKVFEFGGPFADLLDVPPREAKRDPRLRGSGRLTAFRYREALWPTEPKTVFYDFLYCQAVRECLAPEELEALRGFDSFTDIEFNPERSLNTQARSAALVRLTLELFGALPETGDAEEFVRFHRTFVRA